MTATPNNPLSPATSASDTEQRYHAGGAFAMKERALETARNVQQASGNWRVAGRPNGEPPVVGTLYNVTHNRKGKFCGVVVGVSGCWAEVQITDGVAGALLKHNEREAGESVTVRDSQCFFTPAAKGGAA